MRYAAVVVSVLAACGDNNDVAPEVEDPVAFVDPRIGTGGLGFAHGSCFVGAAVPHGLVKLGPDTNGPFGTINFLHYSGYFAEDDRIQGFSHVHLHGAGASDYGVLSTMPFTAFDPAKLHVADYEARFDKLDEHAAAGRYEVALGNGIGVGLTATTHAGVHRYTDAGGFVLDLDKTLSGGEIDAASLEVGASEVTGQLHHIGGMSGGFGGYTVYFVLRASEPLALQATWSAGSTPGQSTTASGTGVGAAFTTSRDVTIAIGISLVSVEGARKNLDAEVPELAFDSVAQAARDAWSAQLSTVLITGGSPVDRRIFYTSLYHAFLMPTVIEDVDHSYQLAGHTVTTSAGWRQMSDLSLWDTYRTVQPLYAWLAPGSAHDSARSLVAFGDQTGIYPIWPLATGETGTMLGSSAEIVIADAVVRGVPGVDADRAWPGLRAIAMDATAPAAGRGARGGVDQYMQLGFVPRDGGSSRTVSLTTEFAHDDFALGNLAGALGNTVDRDALLERRKGWRTLYDPSAGFLRGRNTDGSFPSGSFDPLELGDDYAEANAWHSLWMAGAHDADGLAEILGGREAAVAKLETFFEMAKIDFDTSDESAANFPRPYYWHGNEPDMNASYLFAQLGRPDLTQTWVRWIEDSLYTDQPSGVAGNDDGGTLGAWYVLSALGIYPIPGSDQWIVGAARFPQARVIVDGRELVITSDGEGPVTSIELDGVPVEGATITHAQLVAASTLHFTTR